MTNEDNRARFTFRLPIKLMDLLKKEAIWKGSSVNALILQILWNWIKENKEERK